MKCKMCSVMVLPGIPACEYCGEWHCTAHLLPEVHGCELEVKNAARRSAENAAIAQRIARKHLGQEEAHRKLEKRLAEGEAARRKKGSNKKK